METHPVGTLPSVKRERTVTVVLGGLTVLSWAVRLWPAGVRALRDVGRSRVYAVWWGFRRPDSMSMKG